jgi:cyclopropane-fatty-acyl-phospholipid synthase
MILTDRDVPGRLASARRAPAVPAVRTPLSYAVSGRAVAPPGVAGRISRIIAQFLGGPLPVGIVGWDGTQVPGAHPEAWVVFRRPRALRWLLWSPDELGLARAYTSGDIELRGDFYQVLGALADAVTGRRLRLGGTGLGVLRRELSGLGVWGPPPRPPEIEARPHGWRHSLDRDSRSISHHYDVGNAFYRLFLGESMTYSCAYWADERWTAPADLDRAQQAKHELIVAKLDLAPGMRLLDVGCGWGSLAIHAAATRGARVVGITLSARQAAAARQRVAAAGLTGSVEIRQQDYRELRDGPFDAISSVGMAEHVGRAHLDGYARTLYDLLAPGGRLLNHAIARLADPPPRGRIQNLRGHTFLHRYVFPDGELTALSATVDALERAGLEVRDVEALREHYGRTLRAWVAQLEAAWDRAVALTSPERARVWRLYLASSAVAFERGRLGVNQTLAVRADSAPGRSGQVGMPRTRARSTAAAKIAVRSGFCTG